MTQRIILSPPERRELRRISRSRSVRNEDVRRANIILRIARAADSLREISRSERCSINTVRLWRERFLSERLTGLWSRHHGRMSDAGSEQIDARIIDWTLHRKPADGSTHWSSRKLATRLGVNHMRVARIWDRAGLQPHGRRHYMKSDDPQFQKKASDIIGLYLSPPAHAAVFCVGMRKVPFRPWTGSIRFCRFLRDGPNAMDLNISATARSPSMLR